MHPLDIIFFFPEKPSVYVSGTRTGKFESSARDQEWKTTPARYQIVENGKTGELSLGCSGFPKSLICADNAKTGSQVIAKRIGIKGNKAMEFSLDANGRR